MSESVFASATLLRFLDLMQQFIDAMQEVFPECPRVREYRAGLHLKMVMNASEAKREKLARECITAFHECMHPYYSRVNAQDESLLEEEIEMMTVIDLPGKWTADLETETKEAIWEYIQQLCQQSSMCAMYDCVPPKLLTSLESTATRIAERISEGGMTLGDLNLMGTARELIQSVEPEEMQAFVSSLRGGGIVSNMSMLTSMLSNVMAALPQREA